MPKVETVSSPANPLLKAVRKAVMVGGLTADGLCVAEAFHLLDEALRSRCVVKIVIAAQSAQSEVEARIGHSVDTRLVVLPDKLFEGLAATESTQGVMALVTPPSWKVDDLFEGRSLVVVLDGVQDPGNAGAIVRAAEAFGATGVLFLKGTVNPFNPKALRASAGSLFRVPFVYGIDSRQTREILTRPELALYASLPRRSANHVKALGDADLTHPFAVIIGSEGHGVSEASFSGAISLSISTHGVDSLNAAMAASIILYEAQRQRSAQS